jgi:hypothetical protein
MDQMNAGKVHLWCPQSDQCPMFVYQPLRTFLQRQPENSSNGSSVGTRTEDLLSKNPRSLLSPIPEGKSQTEGVMTREMTLSRNPAALQPPNGHITETEHASRGRVGSADNISPCLRASYKRPGPLAKWLVSKVSKRLRFSTRPERQGKISPPAKSKQSEAQNTHQDQLVGINCACNDKPHPLWNAVRGVYYTARDPRFSFLDIIFHFRSGCLACSYPRNYD